MLDTVFYFILNMSITSCFVIAALLLVRQVRPLPRRVVYPLWALAAFRLATPFSLPTSFSLFNFTGGLVKRLVTVETITQGTAPVPGSGSLWAMNMVGAAVEYAPVEYRTETLRQSFQAASATWAIITAVLLSLVMIFNILARKELKNAVLIKDGVYRSDTLPSPVLAGLAHPVVILPASLDPGSTECKMILTHENIHKRRLDNLWRLSLVCIACFHWFNPLAWVMLKAFLTDMELSCDENVIREYTEEERKAYAGALLRFADGRRLSASAAFGHSGVKARIAGVLNYKSLTLAGVLASSLFLAAIAIALITNPQIQG